ncbi:MAG: DNA-directed DNA polymerase II small subunit [Candidatus Natronoplasma sp.]
MIGMRDQIVRKLARKNTLITPDAWEYLEGLDEQQKALSIIERLEEENEDLPFPVCKENISCLVEDVLEKEKKGELEKRENEEEERKSEKKSSEMDRDPMADLRVLKDISGESTCTGCIDDFKTYFQDRFERIKSIVKKRRDGRKARPIKRIANRAGDGTIIAMVRDIYTSSNGNKMLTLEDDSGEIRGFISNDSEAFEKDLLEDEVILAKGEVWENNGNFEDTFAIEEITRPDIPRLNRESRIEFSGKIAFLGDIHVGSDTFLKNEWDDFISWINSDDEEAEAIRFLVIPGDLIDGIGIFPDQEKELEIIDIYEQYRKLADMLQDLPEDITVITIPGNHDIVRNAEPQPCLPEDVQEMFPDNVLFFGNPSLVDLDGLKMLMYHGSSINDLSDMLPQVSSEKPITAMREMLKRRHLVPVYGKKTSIAPEEKDHLVIDEVPDIFITGHIHRTEVETHHGVLMVNASTWQAQTEYQKMRDIQPDPAKVIVLDPETNKASIRDFS